MTTPSLLALGRSVRPQEGKWRRHHGAPPEGARWAPGAGSLWRLSAVEVAAFSRSQRAHRPCNPQGRHARGSPSL